jgi:iron complex transport system substrate-binding protein
MRQLLPVLLFAVSLLSCGGGQQRPSNTGKGDTLHFKYARLLHVVRYDSHTDVLIDNPWKEGKTLHRYRLVPHDAVAQHQTEQEGTTLVRVPLQRSVIFTSLHAALMAQIDATKQVAGVADEKYMKVAYIRQGLKDGSITDCGDGLSPMVEKIIDTHADGILLSPFENSGGYGKLEEIGIPLIECAEYMEASPLARAEWMRFYGMLFGQEQKADSLFAVVDSCYHALRDKVAARVGKSRNAAEPDTTALPLVLMDKQTGSVWYVPGGRSTIGRMLVDAACRYPFAADRHSGSLPLPFETVLEKCGDSDVWLFRYDAPTPMTLSRLLAEQPGYSQLRPVRTGRVFGCNVTTSLFYEESPFRPDYLLQDFIHILHPELSGPPPLRYYHQVE